MKSISNMLLILFSVFITSFSFAADEIESHPVQFAKGTSSVTINGSIVGNKTIDYKLRAKAGQEMKVSLQTNNTANYFNVLPQGSETAIYNSSMGENKWSGALPSDGEYTIRVYLMRSAARRNEKANYTLNVGIHNANAAFAPSVDAKVPGTNYHATGQVPCAMSPSQPTGSCSFGVNREGNGSGMVTVNKQGGGNRVIFFTNGKPTGYDQSQADTGKFSAEKRGDLNIVHIGGERYEIPDAVIYGG